MIAVLAAVAVTTTTNKARLRQPGSRTSVQDVTATLDLPPSAQPPPTYGPPVAIVSDPSAPGIWMLAGSTSDVSLFHWNDVASTLTSYSLGNPRTDTALQFGDEAGLAVSPSGEVFVGLRATLFELEPASGSITEIDVPPPKDNLSVESARPSVIRGFHGIENIAISPLTGDVAIAMEAAASVPIYHPDGGSFSSVILPMNDAPTDVAYAADGTLVVSAVEWPAGRADIVDVLSPAGDSLERGVVDATSLSSDEQNVLATGSSGIMTVSPAIGASPRVEPYYANGDGPPVDFETKAAAGPAGIVIASTSDGALVVLRSPTSTAEVVALPRLECEFPVAVSIPSPEQTTTVPSAENCQVRATHIAVDLDRNIWYTTNLGPGVAEIPVGQY
jgi:hypothetical protein